MQACRPSRGGRSWGEKGAGVHFESWELTPRPARRPERLRGAEVGILLGSVTVLRWMTPPLAKL